MRFTIGSTRIGERPPSLRVLQGGKGGRRRRLRDRVAEVVLVAVAIAAVAALVWLIRRALAAERGDRD